MEKQSSNQAFLGISVFGAIFFIFGFATTFIVTLSAPVKEIFSLSEFEAQLLSSAFFYCLSFDVNSYRSFDR